MSRAIVCAASLVMFAGCGDDDAGPADTTQATTSTTTTAPAPQEQTYTVESGDTLTSIAAEFDVTVDAIVAANDIEDPDVLGVGQVLTIPSS